MGNCTTKPTRKQDTVLSNRQHLFNAVYSLNKKDEHDSSSRPEQAKPRDPAPSVQEEQTAAEPIQRYKSCILEADFEDQEIARIVRLETACISLKSKIQKLKQESMQLYEGDKYFSEILEYSHRPSSRSTHTSIFSLQSDISFLDTVILFADFVQERAYRLWENKHDEEIVEALSSLSMATAKVGLPCLIDFEQEVSSLFQLRSISI